MGNRFDAKDAFAFGIDLERQLAVVQLEDRQIIRRSLDRDFALNHNPRFVIYLYGMGQG